MEGSAPAALPQREVASSTHWVGDGVGPRAGLDAREKREIVHCQESNQPVALLSTD
jgi:hypothetical protein